MVGGGRSAAAADRPTSPRAARCADSGAAGGFEAVCAPAILLCPVALDAAPTSRRLRSTAAASTPSPRHQIPPRLHVAPARSALLDRRERILCTLLLEP